MLLKNTRFIFVNIIFRREHDTESLPQLPSVPGPKIKKQSCSEEKQNMQVEHYGALKEN